MEIRRRPPSGAASRVRVRTWLVVAVDRPRGRRCLAGQVELLIACLSVGGMVLSTIFLRRWARPSPSSVPSTPSARIRSANLRY